MAELDLTDRAVRSMAERNHTPEESWMADVNGVGHLVHVNCETCYHPWPCPTRVALRALAAADDASARRGSDV